MALHIPVTTSLVRPTLRNQPDFYVRNASYLILHGELCMLAQGCLNGTAPRYLSDLTVSVGSASRRQLCSASTSNLVVPPTRRASIGDRAFAVAGLRLWNSLPPALCSTSKSFTTFKKNLHCLFGLSQYHTE